MKDEKMSAYGYIKQTICIIVASVVIAFNIKTFVQAGGLIPGGFTGIAILTQEIMLKFFNVHIPYTPINLVLNAFPIILGLKFIGKKFIAFSCLAIVVSSILVDLIPAHPLTYDLLLISIFGGIVSGAAISLCLSAGASSGGANIIAIYFSEKYGIDTFGYVLFANAVLLAVAGFIFGWEKALYSIIFQFTSTEMIHMCYRRYQQNTLLIITDMPVEVAEMISKCARHGSTAFAGMGTYEKKERTMIYSVVGSDEVKTIIPAIKAIDDKAFINVIKTDSLVGRFYYKPHS